mmetsp:Transcript_26021/g.38114  ORF Transcript_26021/g.38114 Transcript_26021/m.38114 type:complete len:239 (-) Transcript_26021:574-1290(-)
MGIHYCFDDASLRPFAMGVQLLANWRGRCRFRVHFGPQIEFELQTYGIPTQNRYLQRPNDSMQSLDWHREWLAACQAQEERQLEKEGASVSTLPTATVIPRRFDVLFGRGKTVREHTGNLRAAHLVDMNRSKYEAAGKFEKTSIAERLVNMIHESHGRFLKRDGTTGWVEVDRDAAREKISHYFRHLRSKTADSRSPGERGNSNGTTRGENKGLPASCKRKGSPAPRTAAARKSLSET